MAENRRLRDRSRHVFAASVSIARATKRGDGNFAITIAQMRPPAPVGHVGISIARDASVTDPDLFERIQTLRPWFHNMTMRGMQTAPEHFLGDYPRVHWETFAHALPNSLENCSVLDVGCNAGFFSIEMKRRGARRVVGIDSDERYLAQARLAAEVMEADIEFKRMTVYDVGRLKERFDFVLFLGVLYHLRHPLLALDLLHEHVVGNRLVFQSMLRGSDAAGRVAPDYDFSETAIFDRPDFPRLHFVEHRYADDPSNWWIPNRACAEAMLRSAGFEVIDRPAPEVFIARTVPLRSAEEDPALHVELSPARDTAERFSGAAR